MPTAFISLTDQTSPPIRVQACDLTLHSQVVRLAWPLIEGGLLWHRPTAVTVQTAEGHTITLPVPDITRRVQIAILLTTLAGALFLWATRQRHSQ